MKKGQKVDMEKYFEIARETRRMVLKYIHKTRSPHIGPSFSIIEILVALYYGFLNITPENVFDKNRDRFILSKGHSCLTLYAVLKQKGFISEEDMNGFAVNDGVLAQHPDRSLDKGIELSTGSLGHGLSVGTGIALAGKVDGKTFKTCVLMSDGELNEGSVWEGVMFAAQHKLNNLIAIIDANKMQALGHTRDIINLEPISEKWKSFGWHVQDIDGHSFTEISASLESLSEKKPNLIVLHTTKGKGVSFMENNLLWHYRAPDDDEYKLALEELSK